MNNEEFKEWWKDNGHLVLIREGLLPVGTISFRERDLNNPEKDDTM